jgi:hypothetical protein
VADTIDKDILATALSAESQVHTLVAAILAPLFGFVADTLGLGYSLIIVSAFLIILYPMFMLRNKNSETGN